MQGGEGACMAYTPPTYGGRGLYYNHRRSYDPNWLLRSEAKYMPKHEAKPKSSPKPDYPRPTLGPALVSSDPAILNQDLLTCNPLGPNAPSEREIVCELKWRTVYRVMMVKS